MSWCHSVYCVIFTSFISLSFSCLTKSVQECERITQGLPPPLLSVNVIKYENTAVCRLTHSWVERVTWEHWSTAFTQGLTFACWPLLLELKMLLFRTTMDLMQTAYWPRWPCPQCWGLWRSATTVGIVHKYSSPRNWSFDCGKIKMNDQ